MVTVTSLAYPGALHAEPSDAGLLAEFVIHDDVVTIETVDGEAFTFGHSDLRAEFYDTRTVRLQLIAGELYFRADDPLRFDAEAMPVLRGDEMPPAADPEVVPAPEAADLAAVTAPPLSARPRRRGGMRWTPEEREMRRAMLAAVPSDPSPEPPQERRPRKRRRRGEHEHSWNDLQLAGGLTRRVCSTCHQVSLA